MRDFIDFRHFVQLKWCNSILRFFQERPPLCIMLLKNCRTEAQFYQAYVNAILKASFTKMDEFMLAAKRYVGSFGPKISLSDSLKCPMIIMIQL